jgi:nucleoside-diphosphate-sugar epimerase
MIYLVTGSAGFLGFYLARALAAGQSDRVICVDNGIRGKFDAPYLALAARFNVQHIPADLTDPAAVAALPDDVDVVFHLAALNGTQNFYERPLEVMRCSTLPTLHLLEKYGPPGKLKRFIYAGTSESYASIVTRFGWEVPTAEDVPLGIADVFNPRWSYAVSKTHGEVATVAGCRQYSIPFSIIRYHNAYGPRMGDKHVIPDFYTRARSGELALFGHEETRSFIYAEDAIRATIAVGNTEAAAGEVVNVGGTREISMGDLGRLMMDAAGLAGEIALHPSPKGSVARRCPNVEKLRRLTGFRENWTLEEGLKVTARYYMEDDAAGLSSSAHRP